MALIVEIFLLLVIYQFKHFICDYLLQNEYMLGKFKQTGWIQPLTAHCMVHVAATLLIASFFTDSVGLIIALGAFDFVTHFAMDRVKASPNMLGRFKPEQKEFWWALGLDQMWHHLTHYAIIYILVTQ
ncbi:MAG: DUF3307 domain-containing protein [Neptunomonas phycophila]|uniref:DUF3307 domain-containing protein n=1 Tax=Neptunomonas phycophila TaxID=1572645 RepID=UPI003B8C5109